MRACLALVMMLCLGGVALGQPFQTEFDYIEERLRHTVPVYPTETVGLIRAVELIIDDQVDGGCWTNLSAVRARLRAELERSNVAVFTEPLASYNVLSPQVSFSVLGYRVNANLCVGHANMRVAYRAHTELGSVTNTGTVFEFLAQAVIWERNSILSSTSLNDQLLGFSSEWVDELVGDIAASRRTANVLAFQEVWHGELPQTKAQFDEMLARVVDSIMASQ